MTTGAQKVKLLISSGTVLLAASSAMDATTDTDGAYNFNYQVAPLL